jgi:DinB superfamily
MNTIWNSVLWSQFGASIKMLENPVRSCPDELWTARMLSDNSEHQELSQFWYIAYHSLFWLDLYLTGSAAGFAPPAPFTLDELDPAGVLPPRTYTKSELLAYLDFCREKCRSLTENLTDEQASRMCTLNWGQVRYFELQLYNLRHVQEHAAQLSLFLGQRLGFPSDWVAQADSHAG